MMMESIKPKKIKCNKCSYEWYTKSKRNFVCCPNCLKQNKMDVK